jgi:hypothetical protein
MPRRAANANTKSKDRPPRSWTTKLPEALLLDAELSGLSARLPAADYSSRDPWTYASLLTSAADGYCDRLHRPDGPYHVPITGDRPLAPNLVRRLRAAWKGDDLALVEAFLACPRFPISHPGIGMAREGMWETCPWLPSQIAKAIRDLGFERAVLQAGAPLDPSKRLAPAFMNFVAGYFDTVSDWDELLASNAAVTVLVAGDKTLSAVAAEHLGYQGEKGLDLIVRLSASGRERFVAAEAKFVSAGGGGQDRAVVDALAPTLTGSDLDVQAVAVVDGLALTPSYRPMYRRMIRDSKRPVVSALLLDSYFAAELDALAD